MIESEKDVLILEKKIGLIDSYGRINEKNIQTSPSVS